LRHPWIILPGGFFYLAFKPRLILIIGGFDFVAYVFSCLRKNPRMSISKIIYSHDSIYWSTAAEFYDVLLNNIFVISGWILGCHLFGSLYFLTAGLTQNYAKKDNQNRYKPC
jgi:omega-6 fatty acid desaturase (delta-12 desaturase)